MGPAGLPSRGFWRTTHGSNGARCDSGGLGGNDRRHAGGVGLPTSVSEAPAVSQVVGKAEQTAMTPDEALARLAEGNQRFASGKSLRRDYPAQMKATATGNTRSRPCCLALIRDHLRRSSSIRASATCS